MFSLCSVVTVGIYIKYILYSIVLIFISNVGVVGGGGVFFLHCMLFPTFLEKTICEYIFFRKNNSFSFKGAHKETQVPFKHMLN